MFISVWGILSQLPNCLYTCNFLWFVYLFYLSTSQHEVVPCSQPHFNGKKIWWSIIWKICCLSLFQLFYKTLNIALPYLRRHAPECALSTLMYVCGVLICIHNIHIYIYTHILCILICIDTYIDIYTYIHIYVHTHVHTHIYIHTYIYIHMYIHMYIYIHTYIYKHAHTHMYVCMCMYMYARVCTVIATLMHEKLN